MKLVMKILISILAIIGLMVIVINVVGPGAVLSQFVECSSIVLRESQSPSGELTASITSSTCEDPSHSATTLWISHTGERNGNGSRIADNTSTDFELTWITDRTLEISSPIASIDENIPDSIAGVQIRYRNAR